MFAEENRRSRRIVARLVRGESLREAVEQLARDHAVTTAWVSAHGVVARATLEARIPMRTESAESRSVEGPFELVSLTGDVASKDGRMHLDASVVLVRHADHGIVTLGGHLVDAEAEGVTVMLDCLDDLGLRREVERPTGLDGWKTQGPERRIASPERAVGAPRAAHVRVEERVERPTQLERTTHLERPTQLERPRPIEPASTAAPGAWAAVAAASVAASSAPTRPAGHSLPPSMMPLTSPILDPLGDDRGARSAAEPMPSVGDWVDHRQFGLCRVDRANPDGELMIKLESGRRKEIRLDFLEVLPPRTDGARRIFPLRPRKKDV